MGHGEITTSTSPSGKVQVPQKLSKAVLQHEAHQQWQIIACPVHPTKKKSHGNMASCRKKCSSSKPFDQTALFRSWGRRRGETAAMVADNERDAPWPDPRMHCIYCIKLFCWDIDLMHKLGGAWTHKEKKSHCDWHGIGVGVESSFSSYCGLLASSYNFSSRDQTQIAGGTYDKKYYQSYYIKYLFLQWHIIRSTA